jgi:hypothetical protein
LADWSYADLGSSGLQLVHGMLAHEQPPSYAAHQDRKLGAICGIAQLGPRLLRSVGRARGQPVEISAHQLTGPSLRHIARKGHRARASVHSQHGANNIVTRPFGITNAKREEEGGAGQALGLVLAKVSLVEVKRRLAVKLEQDVALGAGNLPARAKLVPTACAAMPDADGVPIEADRRDRMVAGRAVAADQGFLKQRAVPGQPAGDRNALAHDVCDTGNQLAAIHVQAVGQDEDPSQVICP